MRGWCAGGGALLRHRSPARPVLARPGPAGLREKWHGYGRPLPPAPLPRFTCCAVPGERAGATGPLVQSRDPASLVPQKHCTSSYLHCLFLSTGEVVSSEIFVFLHIFYR